MVRSAAETRRWKGVPSGSTSIASMARRSPAKYAASASAISAGGLVSRAGERAEPIDETLQRLRPLAKNLRRARDAPDALGTGAREPDLPQRCRRELLRGREQMREPVRRGGAPRAERFDQASSEGGGGAH